MSNYGFNMKAGINYCVPGETLGFRGISKSLARLVPIPEKHDTEQLFLMFGVDVSTALLPYIPDMGPKSDFIKKGHWHHYQIEKAAFIWWLIPKTEANVSFELHEVVQVVWFTGETAPRIFINDLDSLIQKGIMTEQDRERVNEILFDQQLVLS